MSAPDAGQGIVATASAGVACLLAAATLEASQHDRRLAFEGADASWEGPHRDTFDAMLGTLDGRIGLLARIARREAGRLALVEAELVATAGAGP